ncbi:hypothetical protein [Microtetraspora fusca]|uniref:hypothetical protein n=1 Tax=Microtetraspora fusca TaxID=1997 RepID=UPI0008328803|nr:hypothetical protein [Microtetraspora fusca]
MSTPSRATVITASVAIGVFGAGTAVGTVLATNSHPTDLSAARLTAGTYRLDDGADAWTTLASAGAGQATSLTGTDGGSTITTGSGKQRICLGTTTDGHAVDAAAQGCASLPVLAASQFAALRRPANPNTTGTPEPTSAPKSEPKSTPKDTKSTPKANTGDAGAAPRPTAKAAGKPPVVTAPATRAPVPTKAPAATVPPATTKTIGATASPAPAQSFTTVTATPVATTSAAPAVTPSPVQAKAAATSPSTVPSPAAGQWGKVIGTTQDGAKLVERSDGSRAIFGPDNKLIRVMPGPWATGVKVLQDGNWLMLRPNGDRMIVSPAGLELAPQQNTAPPTPPTAGAGGTGTGTGTGTAGGTATGGTGAGGTTTTGGTGTTGTSGTGGTGGAGTGDATGGTGTGAAGGAAGGSDITTGTRTGSAGDRTGHRTRHGSGHGDGEHRRHRSQQGGSEDRSVTGSGTEGVSGTDGRPDGGAADGTGTGTDASAGVGTGTGLGTGTGSGGAADGGSAYAPGMEDALPVLQDPELLQRASQALGLDDGMSYTDENGVWDLNIAPPGTPPCRDYSRSELSRRGIPRDSCALPAFVRWLYADPAPGEVSNWTKFTGLPERNLELVVTNPSAQPAPAGEPGRVEPDTSGYTG